MIAAADEPVVLERPKEGATTGDAFARPTFDAVYAAHFDFVWRSVRRLGVAQSATDDAVQDVFLVVHRKLGAFEGRSSVRTWLFGIVRRVARDHRPRREREHSDEELGTIADSTERAPDERAARNEAARLLDALLQTIDEDKREAFILAELEQFTVPEISEALGVNLNTVYARVRAARQELEQGLARVRAQQQWKGRANAAATTDDSTHTAQGRQRCAK
jgi:RNA polymerase sigma-70 factor (ECF subfamily)